jgi:CRISPR-associated endonuclease/helicase Cas3
MGPTPAAPSVDRSLWGKLGAAPYKPYPLINHLLDTSAAAYALWDHWLRPGLRDLLTEALAPGDPASARAQYAAIAGLHDIGKINAVFQGQMWAKDQDNYRDDFLPGHLAVLSKAGYDVSGPVTRGVLGTLAMDPDKPAGLAARRHEAISLMVVAGQWPGRHDPVSKNWAAAVLGAHHGRFHPNDQAFDQDFVIPERGIDKVLRQFTAGKWGEQQAAHMNAVLEATGVTLAELRSPLARHQSAAVILLSGLVTLADWLASTGQALSLGTKLRINAAIDPRAWLDHREQWFPAFLDSTLGVYQPIANPIADIMREHADTLSDLQAEALTVGRGLWIATVPAGDGKTEAALLRHSTFDYEGALFALPTRATTDAMWVRIQGTYANTPNYAALLHGHAQLDSFYAKRGNYETVDIDDGCGHSSGLTPNDWLTGSATALLAPLSVSTCDQVLVASLTQRRSFLRLLAVANRHIILDEVHTYDTFQATLLEELLTWLGATDTRVTLLSASLPEHRLQDYTRAYAGAVPGKAIYPGATTALAGEVEQRPVTSRREFDLGFRIHEVQAAALESKHVSLAMKYRRASASARIAIVVNQVDRAIEIGRRLEELGENVVVFHSRMTAGHRKEISERLMLLCGKNSTSGGVTVVGTQVIEASLDVDFDCMISDLAPAPALIQRAGRLWRHSHPHHSVWSHKRPRKGNRPILDIIVPLDDNAKSGISPIARYPYLMAELKRTLGALIAKDGVIAIPADVQELVDAAAITAADVEAETEEDLQDEYFQDLRRARKAGNLVIPFRGRGHKESVLADDLTFQNLSRTTTASEADDASTRFIDQDQETFLLIDPLGVTPYAWHGTAEQAAAVRGGDNANALLRCTFTLTLKLRKRMPGLVDAIKEEDWHPKTVMFNHVTPVFLLDPTQYSALLGLKSEQMPRM